MNNNYIYIVFIYIYYIYIYISQFDLTIQFDDSIQLGDSTQFDDAIQTNIFEIGAGRRAHHLGSLAHQLRVCRRIELIVEAN